MAPLRWTSAMADEDAAQRVTGPERYSTSYEDAWRFGLRDA